MKKQCLAVVGAVTMAAGIALAGTADTKMSGDSAHSGTVRIENHTEAEFPSMAKITADQALAKAMAEVHGKVLKMELEGEDGFLVYELELVTADKSIKEVKVDAGSGKILAVEADEVDHERQGKQGDDEDEED